MNTIYNINYYYSKKVKQFSKFQKTSFLNLLSYVDMHSLSVTGFSPTVPTETYLQEINYIARAS